MKYLLTLLLLLLPLSVQANTTITALPTIPSPGVVLGTSVMAIDQNSTGTLTTYQASFNALSNFVFTTVNPICSVSGMQTVCGSAFGFVLPQWYGGFCDSNWNGNNNFHDDGPAITTALASGYPVYIYHCKIASTVYYSGNGQQMMSYSEVVPYDTNVFAQPFPGAIFIPNNLNTAPENVAISFNGYNNVGLYGINAHCNFNAEGTAVIGTDKAQRGSLDFADVNYFHAGNCGMGVGGPTDGVGTPVASGGGDPTCGFFGCFIVLKMDHFAFNNDFWSVRANFGDASWANGYFVGGAVSIACFNQFCADNTFANLKIEDNFTAIPTGTSSIYLTPSGGVTTGASGQIIVGGGAQWEMNNVAFETNGHPNVDMEGGTLKLSNYHMYPNGANVNVPFDTYVYVSTVNGGVFLTTQGIDVQNSGHPASFLAGGTSTAITSAGATAVSITDSFSNFTPATFISWSATPAEFHLNMLGQYAQNISPFGSGSGIGTALPKSGIDLGTQGLSVGSSYSGVTASPNNGAIIQGSVGLGTSAPIQPLDLRGLATLNGVVANGTPFVVASGCGTTGAVAGGTTTGSFTAGATSCIPVITLPTAPHGWICGAKDLTNPTDVFTQTASSVTGCTVSATVTSSDVILIHAEGY